MRGLSVNNSPVDITHDPSSVLNVQLDGCPPAVASADQCLDPQPEAVYAGDDQSFLDLPLRVFTGMHFLYLYNYLRLSSRTVMILPLRIIYPPWCIYNKLICSNLHILFYLTP